MHELMMTVRKGLEESMETPSPTNLDLMVLYSLKNNGGYMTIGDFKAFMSARKLSVRALEWSLDTLIMNGLAKTCPNSRDVRYKATSQGATKA